MKLKFLTTVIALDILLILLILIMLIARTGEIHRAQNIPPVANDTTTNTVDDLPPHVQISLYGVMLEDGGTNGESIGCGDSLVPVREYASEQYRYLLDETQNDNAFFTPAGVIAEALRELINLDNDLLGTTYYPGDFYTAAHQPRLTIDEVEINGEVANIFLKGRTILGGVCDTPRFKAQMERTVTQFDDIDFARFYLNGSEQEWQAVFSSK